MVARWRHWEFWPMWAAYPPVIAWIAVQAIRHGSLRPITAANPGFPDGGLVGESKHQIQSLLPSAWAVPSRLIEAGSPHERLARVLRTMNEEQWRYPIVLKPDVGQRGVGVRRVMSDAAVQEYLAQYADHVVVQPWHPGPFEAGIFYARHPDESRGRILSITDKVFPAVVGDGRSTLAELIANHPRFRLQRETFYRRHSKQLSLVLESGRQLPLAEVGNHSQGTMFLDGAALWSTALEQRIDEMARAVPGFFIGRFDVRYADVDRFRSGTDISVIELNGVTAEPTDIYDPNRSIVSAYAALFDQWRRVFQIGDANRRRGCEGASMLRLAQLCLAHLADARKFPVSS